MNLASDTWMIPMYQTGYSLTPQNTGSSSHLTFTPWFSLISNPHLTPPPHSENGPLLGYWHPLISSQPHSSFCYITWSPPFSSFFAPEHGGTMFLWNNDTCLQNYMESHPWWQSGERSNYMMSEDMMASRLADTLLMSWRNCCLHFQDRRIFYIEEVGSRFLQNTGNNILDFMVSHPTIQSSSHSLPWEPESSHSTHPSVGRLC